MNLVARVAFLSIVVSSPLPALTVWGIDIKGLEVQAGYTYLWNSVPDSAPDPLCNNFGISVPLVYGSEWTVRPEFEIYFQSYAYENSRAVPIESMFDNVLFLNLLINLDWGHQWTISPVLSAYVEGGLAAILHFPIFFNGQTAGDMALPITGWFLAGRFIYPNVAGGLAWQFSPLFALTLRTRLMYPIFNLWGGTPWYDQTAFSLNLGVRFTF